MVLFNYSTREITAKIVYYGPGLCGKTTNLQYIHENLSDQVRGKMLSLATKTDRTLFFDFLPIDLGEIRGMKTRVQLYTVPGQVFYNETRKLVLKGADGIVFVADSQETMIGANVESFKNLEENLKGHGLQLADIPHVIQFNKRDLPRLAAIEDLNAAVNKFNAPFYESVAVTGIGVQDTLKAIVKLVLLHLTRKYDPKAAPAGAKLAAEAAPPARPVAVRAPAAIVPAVARPEPPPAAPSVPARASVVPAATERPVPRNVSASAGNALPSAPFRDEEIDGLVDEVQPAYDVDDAGTTDQQAWENAPAASAVAASRSDEGTWMGSAEDEAAPTMEAPPPSFDEAPKAPSGPRISRESGSAHAPVNRIGRTSPAGRDDTAPSPGGDVTLTEVVDGGALFDDPALEVASLDPGEAREIVVPVQLGAGAEARRFKLSIRLRLDPVE